MKGIVLSLVVVAVVAIMIAEAASPVRCPSTCNAEECPELGTCSCGTHKDSCDCCSFCSVCAGEACSVMRNDVCAEGYSCTYPDNSFSYINSHDGTCTAN